jgi:L-lysine exporter family protein LysE/ArgO
VLIVAGALGFGTLVSAFPVVTAVAAWGGAAFLAWHGAMSVRSAMHPESLEPQESGAARLGLGAAISATLAISLLNPHVYLDTVVLIGSVAAQYEPLARAWFTAGACLASLVWFASIGYGARLLAPLFDRPVAWRVLDIVIAVVMFSIAASLVWGQIG